MAGPGEGGLALPSPSAALGPDTKRWLPQLLQVLALGALPLWQTSQLHPPVGGADTSPSSHAPPPSACASTPGAVSGGVACAEGGEVVCGGEAGSGKPTPAASPTSSASATGARVGTPASSPGTETSPVSWRTSPNVNTACCTKLCSVDCSVARMRSTTSPGRASGVTSAYRP